MCSILVIINTLSRSLGGAKIKKLRALFYNSSVLYFNSNELFYVNSSVMYGTVIAQCCIATIQNCTEIALHCTVKAVHCTVIVDSTGFFVSISDPVALRRLSRSHAPPVPSGNPPAL